MEKKITQILEEIADVNSEWSAIMDNIISPNYEMKPELLSEVAMHIYNNRANVKKALDGGWFRFFFISMCSQQIKSSRSSFHINCRQTLDSRHNHNFDKICQEMESGFSIREHEEIKQEQSRKTQLIKLAMDKAAPNCEWVECEMARLHLIEGLSFRKIESFYEGAIKYTRAHQLYKRWKNKFDIELENLL